MSELSQEARDLIENTIHADDPSDADRTRLRARMAARLGAVAVASTAGAAHSTMVSASTGGVGTSAGSLSAPAGGLLQGASRLSGLFKVAVTTGLAGAIGGSIAWFSQQPELGSQHMEARHMPSSAPIFAPAPEGVPRPVVIDPPKPTVEPLGARAAEMPEAAGEASAVEARQESGSSRRGSAHNESRLGDELSLLAQAQQALRDGNPALALTRAEQHRERFPRGSLREERFGIEALARCALGHDSREVVAALARLSPSSPLLVRVRAACGMPQ